MAEKYNPSCDRYFFAIGCYHPKQYQNVGSLLRSAYLYNASFTFTIGERYSLQRTDTPKSNLHCPHFTFKDFKDLLNHIPSNSDIVAIEKDERRSRPIESFTWPSRPIMLLGAEDYGIPQEHLNSCRFVTHISTKKPISLNVASAGAICIYDYHSKRNKVCV